METKYRLESWDLMKLEWQPSVGGWSYRYQPVRDEWEALVADAQNAQMPVAYRVIDTRGVVYDYWKRTPTIEQPAGR